MCLGVRQGFWKWLAYGTIVGSWVVAAAFLGIGIYLAVETPFYEYETIFPSETFDKAVWETPVYLTISLSVGVVGLGILGFCGARKERRTFLLLFALPGIGVAALLLASAIMAGIWAKEVGDDLVPVMANQLYSDYNGDGAEDAVSKDWNNMQKNLQCCGAYYFADYRLYSKFYQENPDKLVPESCCRSDYTACLLEAEGRNGTSGGGFQRPVYLYTEGCYWAMVSLVDQQTALLISAVCIGAAVMSAAVLFACLLRGSLKLVR